MDEHSGCNWGDFDKDGMAKKNVMKPPRQSAPNVNSSHSSKRKNKKSPWWLHYDEVDDTNFAKCKYCGTRIGCSSRNGTSALKNHIGRCKKYSANGSASSEWKFDPEAARKAIVLMVIIDEVPFSFVEGEGFVNILKYLNPSFEPPSKEDVIRESYLLFKNEGDKLKDIFRKLSSRVSLTTDAWTCGNGYYYMRLTARFIDADWVLHKSIINFTAIDDYSGESIGTFVEESLGKWGIKKLMAVTVENADSSDLATDYLRKNLNEDSIILNGKYLHIRCFAQMLNTFVKDGLKEMADSLSKVRFIIRYFKYHIDRVRKLKACVEDEGLGTDNLIYLGYPQRWDTTYLMLQSALKYQEAYKLLVRGFSCSLLEDLRDCGDDVPTDEDWEKLNSFLPVLKVCCDATKILFRSRSLTCNDYLHNVFAIGLTISKICNVEDEGCRKMAEKLKLNYDQYWGDVNDINHLLFVALILDPTRKMKYVDWLISITFEDTKAENLSLHVKALITKMFEEYDTPIPEATSSSTSSPVKGTSSDLNVLNFSNILYLEYEKEIGSLGKTKTELDKYLEYPCEDNVTGFSVLNWWKDNQKIYPVLAKMARDVLAVSMSCVYANSAFLTEGPTLDSYRTNLSFELIELLVCTKDWIKSTEEIPVMEEDVRTLDQVLKDPEDMDED